MPSLNSLDEFMTSFSDIANEKGNLMAQNLEYDFLPLPGNEPPPIDFSRQSSSPLDDSAEEAPLDDAGGGFDFNAFLGTLPAEISAPHLDEPPSIDDVFANMNDPPSIDDAFAEMGESPPADDAFAGMNEMPTAADAFADINQPSSDDGLTFEENTSAPSADDFFDFPQEHDSPDLGLEESDASSDFDLAAFGGDVFPSDEQAGNGSIDMGGESSDEAFSEDTDGFDSGVSAEADDGFDLASFDIPEESTDAGFEAEDDGGFGIDDSDDGIDMGGESFSAPEADTAGDAGFNLDDFAMPESDESFAMPESDESFDMPETDESFDMPESDESFDMPESETDDMGGSIDMGGESFESADFDLPAEGGSSEGDGFDLGSFDMPETDESFEMPQSDESFDMPAADDSHIDMGGEGFEDFGAPSSDADFGDFDSSSSDSGFGDFDSPMPDTDFMPMPDTDFDMTPDTDFDMTPDTASDSGESPIEFGSDFDSDSIELETEQEESGPEMMSSGSFGDDDFTIPGLEEIFEKTKTETTAAPAPKKKIFGKKKPAVSEEFKADDDVEEIKLDQDELNDLLKTLSAYPINLRVACEELIVEKVLLPQQLSKLIYLLKNGAGVREIAPFAEELLGRQIVIPRGFEKMTGAAFEAEQASFSYIFVHNFLPVLRLFAMIAALAASVLYLGYRFIYTPIKAESIYKRGYERIPAGEYQRANQLFSEAFATKRKKKWFYLYAEAFRDQRRFLLAEEKYDDLLRYYPRDKQGVLDYAKLETNYMLNYDKANRLLQQQLLDYAPNDYEGLVAAGDNFLLWGDSNPERFYDKYEDARFSYARVIDKHGMTPSIMERMMKYFIRTDNLKEVLYCRVWFENDKKAILSPSSLAELGGYLLDKQLEEVKGVPDAYLESIESVRSMLLQAVRAEPELPEPHYHLARYYHNLGNTYEERLTLENAIRAFDLARTENAQRRKYRVDTYYRYANLLINNREFFPAEEQVVKGIQLYEDFLERRILPASVQLGQLYSLKGDIEYFVKTGDMNAALNDYRIAEKYGYSPPEVQYRMGSAYYQLQDWRNSLEYLVKASADLPLNRRLLYALGNVSYQRGDYFAAQGYFSRLIDLLDSQRIRLPLLLPNDDPQFLELGERIMMAMNNAGVVYEKLADQTTNRNLRSTAIGYYAESARAWDSITRNPETMIRMNLTGSPGTPGINLGYLNASNAMRPAADYNPEIFVRIDKDVLEPSKWEHLAPGGGF